MNSLNELDPLVSNKLSYFKLQNWNVCEKMEYMFSNIRSRESILKYMLKNRIYILQN